MEQLAIARRAAENGDMHRTVWARRRPPAVEALALDVWHAEVASPAAITGSRSLLNRHVSGRPLSPADDQAALEVLLLAYEELASNALRHGRRPVGVTVTTTRECWLIDVVDAAADSAPTPAVDRDPARGGLGLHLVARLCTAHGWWADRTRKHVWACVPRAVAT